MIWRECIESPEINIDEYLVKIMSAEILSTILIKQRKRILVK